MAPSLKPGDRVILEIRTAEVFEGNVEFITEQRIELCNIYCQSTDTKYEGNMTFYRNEVRAVSLIDSCASSDSSANGLSQDIPKRIKLHRDEFARLKDMTLNFVFIDIFGPRFDNAVEVLSNRESVGVVGLGNTFMRGKPLSLLLLCDFKQVYIFDLFCLVHLKGIKAILESPYITKVVHGGSALFDCLYHKYTVEMANVLDTQVVDSMISEKDNNQRVTRDISECLTYHFNFPPALLSAAMEDRVDKMWLERPVIKSLKIKAAQLVTYLLTLRDHLMKMILKEYTEAVQLQLNKYKKMSDIEVLTKNLRNI